MKSPMAYRIRGLLQLDSDFANAEAIVDLSNKIALTNEELFGVTFSTTAGLFMAPAPTWSSIDPISVFKVSIKMTGLVT